MLRLGWENSKEESPDLYVKVIRPLDELSKRYLIHFISVSPGMQARLRRLASRR